MWRRRGEGGRKEGVMSDGGECEWGGMGGVGVRRKEGR